MAETLALRLLLARTTPFDWRREPEKGKEEMAAEEESLYEDIAEKVEAMTRV